MNDYDLKKSLGFKIDRAARLTTLNFSKKLKENNFFITPEQWGIINFLKDGKLTQNQIGSYIKKDHTCVSRLIENLLKKDIVTKINSEEDKRVNFVFLTEKGKKMQKDITKTVRDSLDIAFKNVTEKEKEVFSIVLDKIIKNLE